MNVIETDHLILRPFQLSDSPRVQELAGEWDVAKTTANIPHPYEVGMADEWIKSHKSDYEDETAFTYAIIRKKEDLLIGAVALHITKKDNLGELGYWIGKPYWREGNCTEASKALVQFGFESLNLNRIQARFMSSNVASRKVIKKLGMVEEGTLRQASYRHDSFHDIVMCAILRYEYLSTNPRSTRPW